MSNIVKLAAAGAVVCIVGLAGLTGLAATAQNSTQSTGASTPKKSTKDLHRFIGKWQFVDEATELAGFTYREEGTTECRYALDGAYIRCDSVGRYNGKSRTYVDYLNYNSITDTYDRVGMFANHPEKATFTMKLANGGRTVSLTGTPMQQRDGSVTKNRAVITFADDNTYVWETRVNKSTEPADSWPLRFIGTYKKVSD